MHSQMSCMSEATRNGRPKLLKNQIEAFGTGNGTELRQNLVHFPVPNCGTELCFGNGAQCGLDNEGTFRPKLQYKMCLMHKYCSLHTIYLGL